MIAAADLTLLDGFERALINHRLHMVYQPKVSLTDGSLKRVEALVRWDDPKMGAVAPSRFVPLAERHGLIDQLTNWGLTTSLRQWRTWHDEGLDVCIAFNISALSLQHLDFPDLVERMCRALEVPTDRLVLELTEGATQPLVKLMDTLTRFRIKGIGLALDDFGVGYSTLMQLRQLPFTEIKIDRFFVKDLAQSNDSRVIVASIVELAHGLGLTVTAEGVETEEQLRYLAEVDCDVAQGYLVGTPLAPEDLEAWSKDWAKRWADGQFLDGKVKARALPRTVRI
ncbi:EAL domain-containing protein [Sphingomonas sp. HDW15A]|uniref:EAL domain-containing protein n=1 Tax=Sphingomonas sp. HDW15A TaxID=2714942 RepID=UPI00140DACF3|nr:EAL domain-containing protein [Sphingomonas sp. HDW15A]QIK95688.1 EAL domain-containing protein [Sphingomonas sp. HDW15A]